jgi:hypothetical protein
MKQALFRQTYHNSRGGRKGPMENVKSAGRLPRRDKTWRDSQSSLSKTATITYLNEKSAEL